MRFLNHEELDELIANYESRMPTHGSPIGKINLDYFTGDANQVRAWRDEIEKPSDQMAELRRIDPSPARRRRN